MSMDVMLFAANAHYSGGPLMSLVSAVDRYIAGWNDHDGQAVVDALTPSGTYEDPTTGGPLNGEAFRENIAGLLAGFPDLHFETVSVAQTGDTTGAFQWIMRGTNSAPAPGRPPTGRSVTLPGADFVDYDPDTERLSRVVGYFDTATMLAQLGLQAHITPDDAPPTRQFGTSLRIDTLRETIPGAFSVTWIDIDADKRPVLQDATQSIVAEHLDNDDYLGSCFAVIGRRHYTFTAWSSTEAARRALRGGEHGAAMRQMRRGALGTNAFGITSIWEPAVMNGVFRADPDHNADSEDLAAQWL